MNLIFFLLLFFYPIFIYLSYKRLDNFFLWFSAGALFYELPKYQLYFNGFESLQLIESNLQYLALLHTFQIVNFILFYYQRSRNSIFKIDAHNKFFEINGSFIYVLITFHIISIIAFIIGTQGDIGYFLKARLLNVEVIEVRSNYYIPILIEKAMQFSSILLWHYNKRVFFFNTRIWYLSSILLLFLYTGSRGDIFYGIIAITTFEIFRSKRMITIQFALVALLMIVVFPILGYLRTATEFSTYDPTKDIFEYQSVLRDEYSLIYYISGFEYLSLLTIPFHFFPSSFLPFEKPIFIDGIIAMEVFNIPNTGYPVNINTESYLNFGFFFLFGYILVFIYYLILKRIACYIDVKLLLPLLIFLANFTSTKIVYGFQILVILLVIKIISNMYENTAR